VAVREVLLAELVSAETRARAAGCPPDVLFEALDARLRAAVEEGRDAGLCPPAENDWPEPGDAVGVAWRVQPRVADENGCRERGDAGQLTRHAQPRWAAHGRDVGLRPPDEDGCREPGDAVEPVWYGQPCWAAEDGCREPGDVVGPVWYGQPCWAAEGDRREPGGSSRSLHYVHPGSAAEDGQDRRHDPVEPGLVGESGG
jgi:hypothetical protein